ncbi:MAG: ribonuclease HII [Spirochaetales bacterium]|nr:ribonuclease HII [Spirochaetales bacterium]
MKSNELEFEIPHTPLCRICGIDEAGRGPLAGPVTAAALIIPDDFPIELLKDSKKLSAQKRDELTILIMNNALDFSIGWVWENEIDVINIHNASLLAMKRAFEGLHKKCEIEIALADGKYKPDLPVPVRAEIKGDDRFPSIMGASILAKTARDRWMIRYSWIEDRYAYEKHKGYPTKEHARRYYLHGPSPIQRMSFNVPYKDDFLKPDAEA